MHYVFITKILIKHVKMQIFRHYKTHEHIKMNTTKTLQYKISVLIIKP